MSKRVISAALVYDFDGTLSPVNMQEHDFIPRLGLKDRAFWKKAKDLAETQDACEVLCYMQTMLAEAKHKHLPIKRDAFVEYGKGVELYKGVTEWFDRINRYAKSMGINLEHYVISSGVKPMIEGTEISRYFKRIFACDFLYSADGVAYAPAVAIDYTAKTQYIFRINKGCLKQYDRGLINEFLPMDERPIPLENMIYIGDGSTDIPAMKMTSHYGGLSVAVYKPHSPKKAKAEELVKFGRADCFAPADYRPDKCLERIVLGKLYSIAGNRKLSSEIARARPKI